MNDNNHIMITNKKIIYMSKKQFDNILSLHPEFGTHINIYGFPFAMLSAQYENTYNIYGKLNLFELFSVCTNEYSEHIKINFFSQRIDKQNCTSVPINKNINYYPFIINEILLYFYFIRTINFYLNLESYKNTKHFCNKKPNLIDRRVLEFKKISLDKISIKSFFEQPSIKRSEYLDFFLLTCFYIHYPKIKNNIIEYKKICEKKPKLTYKEIYDYLIKKTYK